MEFTASYCQLVNPLTYLVLEKQYVFLFHQQSHEIDC